MKPLTVAAGLAGLVVLGAALFVLFSGREAPAPVPERPAREAVPATAVAGKTTAPESPGPGFSIAARLLRSDGSPAAGVPVELRRHQEGPAVPQAAVRSGGDGRWVLGGVPEGSPFELVIDDPESALLVLGLRLPDRTEGKEVDLGDLTIEPPHSLRVVVVGPDDQPVRQAEVVTMSFPEEEMKEKGVRFTERQVPERGEGEYVLDRVPPGKWPIEVRARGFIFRPYNLIPVEVPQTEPAVVRLEPGARLAGTVRDAEGKPVPGAELNLYGSPESQYYQGIRVDAAGRFVADFLVPGEYDVRVEAEGYASQRRLGVATGGGDLEFTIEPEAVFSGRVIDEEGNPVGKATVRISPVAPNETGSSGFARDTDAGGGFEFKQIAGAVFQVSAEHDHFLPFNDADTLELISGRRVEGRVIRLPRGFHASGRVIDAADQIPIAGAWVEFRFLDPERRKGDWHSDDSRSAACDPDGAFVVKGLREGQHEIVFDARGYFRAEHDKVTISGGDLKGLELALRRGGSISGRVLDAGGRPLAKARVTARAPSIDAGDEATSDREGTFHLLGLPAARDYRVQAAHQDFAPAAVPGIPVKAREDVQGIEFRLSTGGSIRGSVRGPDGSAVAECRVYAEGESEDQRDQGGYDDCDEEGSYQILHLPPGAYTLTAGAAGLVGAKRSGIRVEEAKAVAGVELTLGAGKSLSGRVVDVAGRPIDGATVELGADGGFQSYNIDSATTAGDGRFTLRWGDDTPISLSASKSGYERAYLPSDTLPPRQFSAGREVTLTLERSGAIAGEVRARGDGLLKGLSIWPVPSRGIFDSHLSRIEPSGRFELGVSPGTHLLQAKAEGFGPAVAGPFTVGSGERQDGVVIDLVPGGRVRGTVLRRGSKTPFEEAGVFLRCPGGAYHNLPRADANRNGSFQLEGVPPGAFELVVTLRGHRTATFTGFAIASGEEKEVDLELDASAAIRGIVRRDGQAVGRAGVNVGRPDGSEAASGSAITGPDGRFEVSELPAGEYRVTVSEAFSARSGSFALLPPPRRVAVAEGCSAEVEFDLPAGFRVSGRVTRGGAAETGLRVSAGLAYATGESSAKTDEQGVYSILLPRPGDYLFTVRGPGNCQGQFDLHLTGDARELDFPLELPDTAIAGLVVDAATGEALPEAMVVAVAPSPPGRPPAPGRRWEARTLADKTGRFALSCLAPVNHDLWAWSSGYAATRIPAVGVIAVETATELRIELEAETVIPVLVVDGRGLPVEGARGYLRDAQGNMIHGASFTSRSEGPGSMEIRGLGRGPCLLTVLHRSFARSEVRLPEGAGGEPVAVRMDPGGSVRIEVLDDSGRPVEGIPLEVLDARGISHADELSLVERDADLPFRSGPDGLLLLERLAPGAYRVTTPGRDSLPGGAQFTVEAGRTVAVRMLFPR